MRHIYIVHARVNEQTHWWCFLNRFRWYGRTLISSGGGGGGGNLGVILVRVCEPYFKTYPIHIPGLRKNEPIHILDHSKCWPIHILPFDFLHPFFAGYYTNIIVNSCNTKNISSLEKSLSEKYVHIPGCQKNGGLSHRNPEKSGVIYFLLKKGGQSYTWQCWNRGLFGTHIRTMPYIGSYPPEWISFKGYICRKSSSSMRACVCCCLVCSFVLFLFCFVVLLLLLLLFSLVFTNINSTFCFQIIAVVSVPSNITSLHKIWGQCSSLELEVILDRLIDYRDLMSSLWKDSKCKLYKWRNEKGDYI